VLLIIYPILMLPIGLAYGARYAADADWAFWLVLAFDAAFASVIYWIAFESALETAQRRREEMIASLSHGAGVLSS
jgi:hypothetical protein